MRSEVSERCLAGLDAGLQKQQEEKKRLQREKETVANAPHCSGEFQRCVSPPPRAENTALVGVKPEAPFAKEILESFADFRIYIFGPSAAVNRDGLVESRTGGEVGLSCSVGSTK